MRLTHELRIRYIALWGPVTFGAEWGRDPTEEHPEKSDTRKVCEARIGPWFFLDKLVGVPRLVQQERDKRGRRLSLLAAQAGAPRLHDAFSSPSSPSSPSSSPPPPPPSSASHAGAWDSSEESRDAWPRLALRVATHFTAVLLLLFPTLVTALFYISVPTQVRDVTAHASPPTHTAD